MNTQANECRPHALIARVAETLARFAHDPRAEARNWAALTLVLLIRDEMVRREAKR